MLASKASASSAAAVSSEKHRESAAQRRARPSGRLFFGYFLLAKQKQSISAAGRTPAQKPRVSARTVGNKLPYPAKLGKHAWVWFKAVVGLSASIIAKVETLVRGAVEVAIYASFFGQFSVAS